MGWVVGDFETVDLLQCCWEDLVVGRLLVFGCCPNSYLGYFSLSLVDYWGNVSWDNFVGKKLVLRVLMELG